MSSTASKETEVTGGSPPLKPLDQLGIHHTPMSERQQLALIKKIEKANAAAARQANEGTD